MKAAAADAKRRCRHFKPACVVEFSIKMRVCNTCCCKKSLTIDSEIESTLRYKTDSNKNPDLGIQRQTGEKCAAFFAWTDGLVRSAWGVARNLVSVETHFTACWKGRPNRHTVFGYKEEPTPSMKTEGSACPYFGIA